LETVVLKIFDLHEAFIFATYESPTIERLCFFVFILKKMPEFGRFSGFFWMKSLDFWQSNCYNRNWQQVFV